MSERKEFEMTQRQLEALLLACRPVPYMIIGGMEPPRTQDNANRAWEQLGKEMGFKYMTVQPISGKSTQFFTAEVTNE